MDNSAVEETEVKAAQVEVEQPLEDAEIEERIKTTRTKRVRPNVCFLAFQRLSDWLIKIAEEASKDLEFLNKETLICIGVTTVVLILTGFFIFVFIPDECEPLTLLIATDDIPTESDGEVIYNSCEEELLKESDVKLIDANGQWSTEPKYRSSSGFWEITFDGYENDEEGFRADMANLKTQINEKVTSLENTTQIDTLQQLYYTGFEVDGKSGKITARANIDWDYFLTDFNYWIFVLDVTQGGAEDIDPYRDIVLSGNCTNYYEPYWDSTVNYYPTVSGTGMKVFLWQIIQDTDFVYRLLARSYQGACSAATVPSTIDYPLNYLLRYQGYGLFFLFTFDVEQVMALDFCNTFPDQCHLAKVVTDDGEEFIGDSAELYETKIHSTSGKYMYRWETGYNYLNYDATYWIYPQVDVHAQCNECSENPAFDCTSYTDIYFHFYTSVDDEPGFYYYTMNYLVQNEAIWNSKLTYGDTHCDSSDVLVDWLTENMSIPYENTAGFSVCNVSICDSQLDRLGVAYGDVEVLAALIAMCIPIFTFLCFYYRLGEEIDEENATDDAGQTSN